MSNATVQRQMGEQAAVRVSQLRLVGGTDAPHAIATVTPITQAPSVRLRHARLLAEDPAMRRRPVYGTRHRMHAPRTEGRQARGVVAVDRAARKSASFLRSTGYALCLALSIVGAAALGLSMQPTPYTGPTIEHSVTAGDSVWSLAAAIGSERPLEEVVLDIKHMNDLDGALTPGQSLVLPTH